MADEMTMITRLMEEEAKLIHEAGLEEAREEPLAEVDGASEEEIDSAELPSASEDTLIPVKRAKLRLSRFLRGRG